MVVHQKKALETVYRLSKWIGIPPACLIGSRMKVSGAIKDDELIWYEAYHNGIRWELTYETEYLYLAEGCTPRPEEFIHLGEPAVQWLAKKTVTIQKDEVKQ